MSITSTLSPARPDSGSLRATVPEAIVAFLQLREGDKLEWIMEVATNKRIVIVRKVEPPILSEDILEIAAKYTKPRRKRGHER